MSFLIVSENGKYKINFVLKMNESTYLDLLTKDIKKNVLEPYQEQIKKNGLYLSLLLENMMVYASKQTIEELEKIFKNKINIEFYTNKYGVYQFRFMDIPDVTLDILIELLQLRIKDHIRFAKRNSDPSALIQGINSNLQPYNIPLWITYINVEDGDKIVNVFEIIQLGKIRSIVVDH